MMQADRVIRIRSVDGFEYLVAKLDGRVIVTRVDKYVSPPHIGQMAYDTSAATLSVYDGKKWVTMQQAVNPPAVPTVQSDTVLYGFRVHIDNSMHDNEVVFDSNVHGFVMNGLSLMKVNQWRDSRVSTLVDQELLDNLAEAVNAMKRYMQNQNHIQVRRM